MEEKIEQALVFTRTKHGADRLAKQLQRDGITAVPIHGNRSQPQRTRALADFKAGAARILVATDIAARGLDIDQLPHVINYELPNVPEDYVHRIGRTGRAGSPGEAISLVSVEEQGYLADIERLMKKRIVRREAAGFVAPPPSDRPEPVSAPRFTNARPINRSQGQQQSNRGTRPGNDTWQNRPTARPIVTTRQGMAPASQTNARSPLVARPLPIAPVSSTRPLPRSENSSR